MWCWEGQRKNLVVRTPPLHTHTPLTHPHRWQGSCFGRSFFRRSIGSLGTGSMRAQTLSLYWTLYWWVELAKFAEAMVWREKSNFVTAGRVFLHWLYTNYVCFNVCRMGLCILATLPWGTLLLCVWGSSLSGPSSKLARRWDNLWISK